MATTPPASRGRLRSTLAVLALRKVPFWSASPWRRLLRLAAFLVYLYVGVGLLLLALQDRLAFPGWTFAPAWGEPEAGLGVVAFELSTGDGNAVRAFWMAPAGWTPEKGAVLFAYGNAQNLSGAAHNMRRWRDALGTAVLGFDYPGYGPSTGRPGEESCYAAAEAAHAWLLAEKHVAARGVILIGESMGGAMATEVASRHGGRMLILIGTYTSFPDIAQKQFFWLPARWLARYRFANEDKIRSLTTPVFIAHGTADGVVPFAMGERLYEAAAQPKRFYPLEDHPHMHPTRPAFYAAVRAFLDETRPARAASGR